VCPYAEDRVLEAVPEALAGWESYYVIVGSSAAALTGLQFVVIALAADVSQRAADDEIGAFATPSIVHFCVALLTSAALSAPWRRLASAAIVLGVVGLAGLLYAAIVIRRARRQAGYAPVFEDWLWHAALPVVAYGLILAGALALVSHEHEALFLVGASTLLLVFIGIHNAWDTVTWLATNRVRERALERAAPVVVGETSADERSRELAGADPK
jgi:hypothetical protein